MFQSLTKKFLSLLLGSSFFFGSFGLSLITGIPSSRGDAEPTADVPYYRQKEDDRLKIDAKKGRYFFEAGFGVKSPKGAFGMSGRYMLRSKWDLHMNLGIETTSNSSVMTNLLGFGTHYYFFTDRFNLFYTGFSLLYRFPWDAQFSVNQSNSKYQVGSNMALQLVLGFNKKFFFDRFYWGAEVSYRNWISKPDYSYAGGTRLQDPQSVLEDSSQNTIGIGIFLTFPIK